MKIEELAKKVLNDETLKKECTEALKSGKILEFAKKNGCEATGDEIKDFFKGNREINDDELDMVSGGDDCEEAKIVYGMDADDHNPTDFENPIKDGLIFGMDKEGIDPVGFQASRK